MSSFWDFTWKIAPALITAGTAIYGAKVASDANDKAANQLTQAQAQATQAEQDAVRRAEIQTEEARRQFDVMQRQASPGLVAMQNVIGRGDSLTPEQIRAVEDARRTTLDSLSGSGLRGSAAATVAAVRDVEGRMVGDFMDRNRSRIDTAGAALAGEYFNQGKNSSDMLLNSSNLALTKGDSAATGIAQQGNINASNTQGQAGIKSDTYGKLAATLAEEIKNSNKRNSTYQATSSGV